MSSVEYVSQNLNECSFEEISSCSKLETSKNFVNQIEILHYDIFIAIIGNVNN